VIQQQLIRQKVVDSNEPEELRLKLLELGWQQHRLYSGDFWFHSNDYKKVGITRKTIPDLLNSIGERLSKQLEEMLDYYDINIILVEGTWHRVSDKIITARGIERFTWDMVHDYLHRWQAKGFILERTANMGHTIHRLNRLYALYQKPYSLSSKTRLFTDDRVLAFPSGCRGKSGQACLDRFGCLTRVGGAGIEDLLKVEGIGRKRADLIWNHFNSRRL